jgi:hypothetical protein
VLSLYARAAWNGKAARNPRSKSSFMHS